MTDTIRLPAVADRLFDGPGEMRALSRDLARGMGGYLTAESTIDVGSRFTLTLPAARA